MHWPRSEAVSIASRLGKLSLKQLFFDLSAAHRYSEQRNFRLEVNTIFQTYDAKHANRVPIVKNWLGR